MYTTYRILFTVYPYIPIISLFIIEAYKFTFIYCLFEQYYLSICFMIFVIYIRKKLFTVSFPFYFLTALYFISILLFNSFNRNFSLIHFSLFIFLYFLFFYVWDGTRTLFVGRFLDDEACNQLIASLIWLQGQNSKDPITLYFNVSSVLFTAL